jgi:hypothetical protein
MMAPPSIKPDATRAGILGSEETAQRRAKGIAHHQQRPADVEHIKQ